MHRTKKQNNHTSVLIYFGVVIFISLSALLRSALLISRLFTSFSCFLHYFFERNRGEYCRCDNNDNDRREHCRIDQSDRIAFLCHDQGYFASGYHADTHMQRLMALADAAREAGLEF